MSDDEKARGVAELIEDCKNARQERILLERRLRAMTMVLGRVSAWLSNPDSPPHEFHEREIDQLPSPMAVRGMSDDIRAARKKEGELMAELKAFGIALDGSQ